MKIDRLIGILSVLLQKDMVTAPELAERFEVSRRTVNRDIEDLCRAGIPIVTRQGVNGGISIMENYRLDRTVLTSGEMQDILAGLQGLDSVNGTNRYSQLMEKLSVGASDLLSANQSVLIDLSSWHKRDLAPKIELIRSGIACCRKCEFRYYSSKGVSVRKIEPYYLVFQWSNWYVWGWCELREDYRLFKLGRMEGLRLSGDSYEKRHVPLPDLSDSRVFPGGIRVKALFDQDCKWRLVEEYGPGCFEEQPDGRLLFQEEYTNRENLITWLLTFREKAELLEPARLRDELRQALEKTLKRYEEKG